MRIEWHKGQSRLQAVHCAVVWEADRVRLQEVFGLQLMIHMLKPAASTAFSCLTREPGPWSFSL